MFERILIPLDGSDLAAAAIEPGLALAAAVPEGLLTLLSVPVPNYVMVPEPTNYGFLMLQDAVDHTRAAMTNYLNTIKQQIRLPIPVVTEVIEGEAASIIIDTASAREIDLIVMTTHGYSGFTRWIMGSVTEKVLRQAPCPVVVIREKKAIKHVMITLDGSDVAETALQPGLEIARRLNARVTLLRIEPDLDFVDERSLDGLDVLEPGLGKHMRSALEVEPKQYLAALAEKHATPELDIHFVTARGKAADGIIDTAVDLGIDLIAMATHGRTGLRRWVYGSITEKVLRQATASMLVVRPPQQALSTT